MREIGWIGKILESGDEAKEKSMSRIIGKDSRVLILFSFVESVAYKIKKN